MVESGSGKSRFPFSPGHFTLLGVLFFLPVAIPALFGWLIGLLATPVFYALASHGYHVGIKLVTASLILAGLGALLVQQTEMFLFSLTFVPLGISLFRSGNSGESAVKSGAQGLLVLGGIWLIFWTVFGVIAGANPYTQLVKILDLGLQQTMELSSSKEAGLSPEMVLGLAQATASMRETLPRLLPGLLLSMTVTTVWLNMVFINALIRRTSGVSPWGMYSEWRLPDQLVWLPICAVVGILFGQGVVNDGGIWLLMLSGLFYFFQGLAVFIALMERWRLPGFVRLILSFILLIQTYGLLFLALLGLIDVWWNFRKKTKNPL